MDNTYSTYGPINGLTTQQYSNLFATQNPNISLAQYSSQKGPTTVQYQFSYANSTASAAYEQLTNQIYTKNAALTYPLNPGFVSKETANPTVQNPPTPPSNNINVNGYTLTSNVPSVSALEKESGLNIEDLTYLKNHMSNVGGVEQNSNCYYLMLALLVYGFDYKVLTANIAPGQQNFVIDENFINDFKLLANDKKASKFIKKTPAYKMGCFDNVGCFGMTAANANRQPSTPITGSPQIGSSLVTDLLDKIHPGTTAGLVDLCNKIRTHSWLSLPKGSFGSLGRIIAKIQGAVQAFEQLVSDIYQGCIQIVQKVYAALNGIIATIQKKLLSIINKIIPLDLVCLILETLQVLMDDINFFTSLFQMSGPFINYLNTFQTYLNTASSLVSNPFSFVQSFLPPEVNNIINTINQIGTDPNGFLADKLNNYGYGYVLNALQGNFLGAIVNKYGPQYAAITPLGNALSKASAIYSRFGAQFPSIAATMGPNIYSGNGGAKIDAFNMPRSNIFDVVQSDYNNIQDKLASLETLPQDAQDAFKEVSGFITNIFTGNTDKQTPAKK